jgi:hypothetical protein
MLNAYHIFSWPNKVPFDREASGIIQARIYMGACIGTDGGMTGAWRVSPRAGKAWFLAVGQSLGTAALVYVTEPPNYTRLSKKIIQRKDNLTNLSPYNPVVREISTDFKPFT